MTPHTAGQWHALVRTAVEDVLAGPADPDTSFFDLGLTSFGLTRIRLALQRQLGRALPDSTLFDHASVSTLAAHLSAEPAPDAPPRPPPRPAASGASR